MDAPRTVPEIVEARQSRERAEALNKWRSENPYWIDVSETPHGLMEMVRSTIAKGYLPAGGVSAVQLNGTVLLYQALVRDGAAITPRTDPTR